MNRLPAPASPVTHRIDPEFSWVETLPRIDIGDVHAARAAFVPVQDDRPQWAGSVEVVERRVPRAGDDGEIAVRLYVPKTDRPALPAVVYAHGGSFVVGGLDTHHDGCGRWAAEVEAVVVNVDYRLAPEHRYPLGLEDYYAVLCWVAGHAADLGVDPDRLAVAGSSAGGGLAAAAALLARDRGGPPLAFQLLAYPALDDRRRTGSMRVFADAPIFDARSAELAWSHYLGPGHPEPSPYAAAARAEDLAALPPAYVLVCDVDPLRDEDLAYATRMLDAGVPVELHLYPGTPHGFDVMPGRLAGLERAGQVAALRRALWPDRAGDRP